MAVSRIRDDLIPSESGSLDLVFDVPGSLLTNPYKGIRTGRFSRTKRMLQIQVAVPESMVEDHHPVEYLLDSAREAIAMAAPVFGKASIPFATEAYQELIEAVGKHLANWQSDPDYKPPDAHLIDLVEELAKKNLDGR
jgi:enoyl reductase-like protein